MEAYPDVNGLSVEDDPSFGGLTYRLPFFGIHLGEVRCRLCGGPGSFIEAAVDLDFTRQANGSDYRADGPGRGGRLLSCEKGWEE